MFQLDDQFLADLGLGALPEEEKKPFLAHIYKQLEETVGIRLSEGLSDEKMDEFGGLMDRNPDSVNQWLATYAPDYLNDQLFTRMAEATKLPTDSVELLAEYAATKWLEINRPDYRDVVQQTLEDIKQEIITNRDAILGMPPAA